MELSVRQHNDMTIIEMQGELNSTTAPQAHEQLMQSLNDKQRVIIDMSRVSYMSSAGIRTLLLVYRAIHNEGGQAALVGLSEYITETLDITGFLEYFNTYETLDAGIQALT